MKNLVIYLRNYASKMVEAINNGCNDDNEFHPLYIAYNKTVKSGIPAFRKSFDHVIAILNEAADEAEKNGYNEMPLKYQAALCREYHIAYHETGKITGCYSFDSSATGCNFCKAMRSSGDKDCICSECYDHIQEHDYKGSFVLPRHWLNMMIMSVYEFCDEALLSIPGLPFTGIIRFNSSGDIQNYFMAANYTRIAMLLNRCICALWAKNVYAVEAAFANIGKPSNMRFIQSVCKINGVPEYISPYADNIFTVYRKDHILEALRSASECNGKACRECGYKCYYGLHDRFNIAELLRIAGKKNK